MCLDLNDDDIRALRSALDLSIILYFLYQQLVKGFGRKLSELVTFIMSLEFRLSRCV